MEEELASVKATIERMRKVIPTEPYIQSIPQDRDTRYRHQYAFQQRQWLENTPFGPDEPEEIQYMTFKYHEPGSSIIALHDIQDFTGGYGEKRGVKSEQPGQGKEREKAVTGNNTPKKKISLDAYKKKKKDGTGATPNGIAIVAIEQPGRKPTAKAPVKGPVERVKEDEEILKGMESTPEASIGVHETAPEKNGGKRRREESEPELAEAHKRQKLNTPQPQSNKEQENALKVIHEEAHSLDELPAKASPARSPQRLPPKASPAKASPCYLPRKASPVRSPPRDSVQEDPPDASPRDGAPTHLPEASSSKSSQSSPEASPFELPPKASPVVSEEGEIDQPELPPKLSPPPSNESGLPSKVSSSVPLAPLGARLTSPLPNGLAEALKAREHRRDLSRSSDISANGRTLTPPRQDSKVTSLKKSPRNGFRANSSSPMVRSDAEDRGRAVTSAPAKRHAVDTDEDDSDNIAVSRKPYQDIQKQQSLVVKLKFKKGVRNRVRAMLNLPPGPSKISKERTEVVRRFSDASGLKTREEAGPKWVAQKSKTAKPLTNGQQTHHNTDVRRSITDQKRTRTEDSDLDERPAKRTKVPVDITEAKKARQPSTPDRRHDIPSPVNSQRAMTTPGNMRKDLLSAVSMRREKSSDSVANHSNTPSAQSQSSPPDTSAPTTNGTAKNLPSSQLSTSTKTPKQLAWETEQKRFEALGRELKHAATAHLTSHNPPSSSSDNTAKPSPPAPSSTEAKLAAVKATESLLAYLLAFTCADLAMLSAEPKRNPSPSTWRSMQGYFGFVKKCCADAGEDALLGLVNWLGVVFNARILELVGPAGNGGDAGGMMVKAAREGEEKLDLDTLMSTFPKTWAGKSKGKVDAEEEGKLKPGEGFAGSYCLPLGVQTSPLRAARAGWRMVGEWLAGREGVGVGYEMRLKL